MKRLWATSQLAQFSLGGAWGGTVPTEGRRGRGGQENALYLALEVETGAGKPFSPDSPTEETSASPSNSESQREVG